jgi:hypothetical protein
MIADKFKFQIFHSSSFLFLLIYKEDTIPILWHIEYVNIITFLSRSMTFAASVPKINQQVQFYNM